VLRESHVGNIVGTWNKSHGNLMFGAVFFFHIQQQIIVQYTNFARMLAICANEDHLPGFDVYTAHSFATAVFNGDHDGNKAVTPARSSCDVPH